MKRLIPLLLLCALPLSAAPAKRWIVVRATDAVAAASVNAFDVKFMAAHAGRDLRIINGFAVTLSDDEVTAMQKAPGIEAIYPVVKRYLHEGPSVPIPQAVTSLSPYQQQQTIPYGIDLVHARDVWAVSRGKNVNVAVLDTGVTIDHPDLAKNIAGGFNIINNTSNFADDHGHGSHTAGTIAAIDNGVGVVGVAPEARIWAVKILGADGNGENEDVIAAADWVLNKKREVGGNWIMSMSFGSGETSPPERQAFERLRDNDILAIASSGNSGLYRLEYPAAYPSVMSVGAVDSKKDGAWFSSGGGTLGVMAPGVDVLSTVRLGGAVTLTATRGSATTAGRQFKESGRGGVTAEAVDCGFGDVGACPPNTAGKIALISRGNGLYYAEKVLNAMNAGAIGAVIYNNTDQQLTNIFGTGLPSLVRCDQWDQNVCLVNHQEDIDRKWVVAVFVTKADGEKLLKATGPVTVGVWDDDYGLKSGTSMATPHAAGVAALLWSLAPNAHAIDIRRAMELTADDLGPRGFDIGTGNGLLNALAAAKAIAPAAFGLPPDQMPSPRRRSINH